MPDVRSSVRQVGISRSGVRTVAGKAPPGYYREIRLGYWLAAMAISTGIWIKILF